MLCYSQDSFSHVIHQHDSSVSTHNQCFYNWILRIKKTLHLAVRVLLHFNLYIREFLFSLIFKHSNTSGLNISLAVTFSNPHFPLPTHYIYVFRNILKNPQLCPCMYRGADKSLAPPGRKQATATEEFGFHISYL